MISGDIVFIYKDNIEDATVFLAYDKKLLLGANWLRTTLKPLLFYTNKEDAKIAVYTLSEPADHHKRKKLTDFFMSVISGDEEIGYKNRSNYLKFITELYEEIFKVTLLDHPSIQPTPDKIIKSPHIKLSKEHNYVKCTRY